MEDKKPTHLIRDEWEIINQYLLYKYRVDLQELLECLLINMIKNKSNVFF